jgi:hypothetical protein
MAVASRAKPRNSGCQRADGRYERAHTDILTKGLQLHRQRHHRLDIATRADRRQQHTHRDSPPATASIRSGSATNATANCTPPCSSSSQPTYRTCGEAATRRCSRSSESVGSPACVGADGANRIRTRPSLGVQSMVVLSPDNRWYMKSRWTDDTTARRRLLRRAGAPSPSFGHQGQRESRRLVLFGWHRLAEQPASRRVLVIAQVVLEEGLPELGVADLAAAVPIKPPECLGGRLRWNS